MNKNIGSTERIIRAVVGIALLVWAFMGGSEYSWIGWIGIVPLATAAIGWCPPYAIFGINTCSVKKNS